MAYKGFFGEYGGQFVAETLIPALDELEKKFNECKNNDKFLAEFKHYLNTYAGRPTPVYLAKNLSEKYGMEIYLKREDLLHTGAHKINNTIGQALLTKYLGKKRVIAETGAGQHGVATATVAALFGLKCTVYMGAKDAMRQQPNVKRMKMTGAEVVEVHDGSGTLKDATSAALKEWVKSVQDTHYIVGSVVGPHPFPEMVAFFHKCIGEEAREFFEGKGFMPDIVIAPVGGGSNAIGIFKGFLDTDAEIVGVEAGGTKDQVGKHARTIGMGSKGILHGALSYLLQDDNQQVNDVHSISAGLDYPGIGPEHSYLKDSGRVHYDFARDNEVLHAFYELSKTEGIIPAMESSHAIAYVIRNASKLKGKRVLINLSGRGDKDMPIIEQYG